MRGMVLVLDADAEQARNLCDLLEERNYRTAAIRSLPSLRDSLQARPCLAVFMDIDTVEMDNAAIRKLTIQHPGVHFFCMSKQRYNPQLKESICYHIHASLNRPIDPDELFFWLESIEMDQTRP